MHLEVQDIFGGDEGKNHAADEVLRQSYFEVIFDHLATNCRMLSKLQLVESGIKLVISKVHTIRWPGDDVILRELDNTAGFRDSILECFETRNYRGIRNLVASLQKDAVTEAWERPYVGKAHICLYKVIEAHRKSYNVYGRILPVVQSSGAGKSRMVDELSKEHLVIPINLRPERERGFPAADHTVREFFDKDTSQWGVYTRYAAFFTALFQQLKISFENIDSELAKHNIETTDSTASKFRFLMTQAQTYDAPNEYRKVFYEKVCQKAETLWFLDQRKDEPMTGGEGLLDVYRAAKDLVRFLEPSMADEQLKFLPPVIILAFDEAHQLTEVQGKAEEPWSRFGELRRNIRKLRSLPIPSLFISTVSKISDFTPAPKQDMSARIVNEELTLSSPFTELGFDQLLKASPIKENTINIQHAATDRVMCRFGRPLFGTRFDHGKGEARNEIVDFAASKLICGQSGNIPTGLDDDQKLACMAVRLALEFNSTTLKSRQREHLQVAKHMRICIKVNDGFETIVSVAASEPILAEGARRLMSNPKFNLPASLLRELQTPGLDKGTRGELVCLVLLLLACDKAVAATATRAFPVCEFFKNLLNTDHYAELLEAEPTRQDNVESSFQKTFADSKIYFNHFIKIHDPRVVNRKYLWMLIARGAAVLCANNQADIDIVVPFTYSDAKLGRKNVSAILIQVKNDRKFSTTPIRWLFDGMNPFFVGLFDHSDEPLPVIRMVFALSSAKPGVTIMEPEGSRKAKETKAKKSPRYTSYDIWCAGAFAETFAVINEIEEEVYKQLLKVCNKFPQSYESNMVGVNHWGAFEVTEEGADEGMDEYDYED
ncbi:hypothetical protein F5887DRAFT_1073392 [Amanita rubescens]|nr:hypothetical protein F5887DRAFT_1073392 [Amanita rubescens]